MKRKALRNTALVNKIYWLEPSVEKFRQVLSVIQVVEGF